MQSLTAFLVMMSFAAPDPKDSQRNVRGGELAVCSLAPVTGYRRTGLCESGPDDSGTHVICAVMTDAFLSFTKDRGNDLVTPRGTFPGLKNGDRWCVCALRWKEALAGGKAPPVVLNATSAKAVDFVSEDSLNAHATP